MKLEELVQNLDAANPWSTEKVESIFCTKLALSRSNDSFAVYTAGPFLYEEGLVIEETHLRLKIPTNEMIRLILNLEDDTSFFTLNRIEKNWPDVQLDSSTFPRGQSWDEKRHYRVERPWGQISFGFKEHRPNCLASITFIPKTWP
ncbi:MAG: hypothetical protein FWH56_01205 [Betaproteobacteria bacterium]|nr:hypothetical protein [Betaproteobacteria bacterium]